MKGFTMPCCQKIVLAENTYEMIPRKSFFFLNNIQPHRSIEKFESIVNRLYVFVLILSCFQFKFDANLFLFQLRIVCALKIVEQRKCKRITNNNQSKMSLSYELWYNLFEYYRAKSICHKEMNAMP